MPFDLTPRPVRTTDAFLELCAQLVFSAGRSWQAVAPTWPSIRRAFQRFATAEVAAYGPVDRARLVTEGVPAHDGKIAAVIEIAGRLAVIRDEHGSPRRWLEALAPDERAAALRRLPYVGTFGAAALLAVLGLDQENGGPAGPLRTTAFHTVS